MSGSAAAQRREARIRAREYPPVQLRPLLVDQPLLGLLRHMVGEGFAEPSFLDFLAPVADVPALMAALTAVRPA